METRLGIKYRDTITGKLVGVATAKICYLLGESQTQIEWVGADGKLQTEWIRDERLREAE